MHTLLDLRPANRFGGPFPYVRIALFAHLLLAGGIGGSLGPQ